MIKVNKVISGSSVAGDGTTLQPAAPLSEAVKAQLFDEFTSNEPVAAQPASSQTVFFAVLLAAILAGIALYVLKQVKPDELEKFKNTK